MFVCVAGGMPRAWRARSPANTGCCSHGGRRIVSRRAFSAAAVQQNPVSLACLLGRATSWLRARATLVFLIGARACGRCAMPRAPGHRPRGVVRCEIGSDARWKHAVRCNARVRGTGLGRQKLFVRVAGGIPRAWRGRSPANTGCCSHGGGRIVSRTVFCGAAVQQNPVSLRL